MDTYTNEHAKSIVLIVDDEITSRFLTSETLVSEGFDVEEAENGAIALKMLDNIKPDIIIADVMMPVMDGFTLCEEIRRRSDLKMLPVLIMTGLDDIMSIHRAYEVGATDFITKPFNWLVLCQRIRHMIRESRLVQELQRSEIKNRALLSAIPDMMVRLDREGTIIEFKVPKDFGAVPLDSPSVSKKLYETLPLSIAQSAMDAVQTALTRGTTVNIEHKISFGGKMHHFEARFVANGPGEVLGIIRDITKRKHAENALRESEERYALAVEGASDGIWDWDMRTNEIYYSLRWKKMLGCEPDEIGSSPDEWLQRIHPEDREQFKVLLNAHLENASTHFEAEHRVAHRDGAYLWVLTRGIAVRDEAGKPYRMAGSQTDVTERRRVQDQLVRDALYDALTGLANRTLLMDRLEQSLRRAKRSADATFAVLFLDLDRFKNVNDTLGHLTGDNALVNIARKLESCVRPGDTVARIGGDEFVILLENVTNLLTATSIAERIEEILSHPLDLDGQEVFLPASIGIVLISDNYEDSNDILRDADIAVYRAKALGRGCYVTFDQSMYQNALTHLELENDLRKAIPRGELFLHYQPIVSLANGSLKSLEALIRWRHPKRGMLLPADFIPLAEENGLIIPIGEWVLRTVCAQIVEWKKFFGFAPVVAVNISGHQLKLTNFAGIIQRIIAEFGLSPDCIELEITESFLMDNMEYAKSVLSELQGLGLHFSLDNFGTGYSSLSYLQKFPIRKLKLDKSFIQQMKINSGSLEIVNAIFQLAKGLCLDVVAEGVETDKTAVDLKDMGCGLAQGFFFGRPTAAEQLCLSLTENCQSDPKKVA